METPSEYGLEDYNYPLPESLIAQHPQEQRDNSRLMVVPSTGTIVHRRFKDIEAYFKPGDLLVLNETKVSAFHIDGIKKETGVVVHCLFTRQIDPDLHEYEVLAKPLRRLKIGTVIDFSDGLLGTVTHRAAKSCRIRLSSSEPAKDIGVLIKKQSRPALPPYIKRSAAQDHSEDWDRYQTIYARKAGSIAAPTAGLHFSENLLTDLEKKGVLIEKINLQIGIGTFQPVRVDDIREHTMEEEYIEIHESVLEQIYRCQKEKRRLFAVGTTVIRALESHAFVSGNGQGIRTGKTGLFIYPGYSFHFDYHGMITNFHLPRSTLLLLVSAFAGKQRIVQAYAEAVRERYRFYSYGDAMLLFRKGK